ncbi:MAG: DUF2231 domain-containing protein [Methylococcaceae bacterium]|jgi:uncharacterized membrane protein
MNQIQNLFFQVHGSADAGNGLIDTIGHVLVFFEAVVDQGPVKLLPGMLTMANWHPLFVHFPIAFLSLFWLVDVIGSLSKQSHCRRLAGWLLYLGTMLAIPTVVLGLLAASSVPHGENVHDIMERHESFGLAVLVLAIILSAWRFKVGGQIHGAANMGFLLLAGLLFGLIILGADLGGLMVYQYGVGVKSVPVMSDGHHDHQEDQSHEHNHDHSHEDGGAAEHHH